MSDNYLRLISLVYDIIGDVLRSYLRVSWERAGHASLFDFLSEEKDKLFYSQDKRHAPSLTTQQWELLYEEIPVASYPHSEQHPSEFRVKTNLKLDDIDVILAHILLKTLQLSEDSDVNVVESIREVINWLRSLTSTKDDVFEEKWNETQQSTLQLAQKISPAFHLKKKEDIERLKTKALDDGERKRLHEVRKIFKETAKHLQKISDQPKVTKGQQGQNAEDPQIIKGKPTGLDVIYQRSSNTAGTDTYSSGNVTPKMEDKGTGSKNVNHADRPMVFFTLGTNCLKRSVNIKWITTVCGDEKLCVYINPTKTISPRPTEEFVHVNTSQEVLYQFLTFIRRFENPVLVAHNIKTFHLRHLYYNLTNSDFMEDFKSQVKTCLDTLQLARKLIPKSEKVKNYKLKTLVQLVPDMTYQVSNALERVQALKQLYHFRLGNNGYIVSQSMFTIEFYECKMSLKPLRKKKVINEKTWNMLAQYSYGILQLTTIYRNESQNGIKQIFRVTNDGPSEKAINRLVQYLEASLLDKE